MHQEMDEKKLINKYLFVISLGYFIYRFIVYSRMSKQYKEDPKNSPEPTLINGADIGIMVFTILFLIFYVLVWSDSDDKIAVKPL